MTVRNEEKHLRAAVLSVLDNGFTPGVEVVIAVGPSHDRTQEVAHELAADPRVRVVTNDHGGTPQGLNRALAVAAHDVVVRVDGHGTLPWGYIARAVSTLATTGAANVGGRMVPDAEAPLPRAIAVAMGSRWGIGGAGHRVGGSEGPTDSVFLGAFRKAALDELGGYDEHFVRAQDWELNFRLRQAGYAVWFEPRMQVAYAPRESLRALARQFHHSGQWRREVTRAHRIPVSARYLIPPLTLLAVVLGSAATLAGILTGWTWLVLGAIAPLGYVAGMIVVSTTLARAAGLRSLAWMPWVLITMHMAWGAGFLRGVR